MEINTHSVSWPPTPPRLGGAHGTQLLVSAFPFISFILDFNLQLTCMTRGSTSSEFWAKHHIYKHLTLAAVTCTDGRARGQSARTESSLTDSESYVAWLGFTDAAGRPQD